MKDQRTYRLRRRQKSGVYTGLQVFQAVLILLQLYLFVSTLESILAGNVSTAIPAAAISAIILVANIWIFIGVQRLERQK